MTEEEKQPTEEQPQEVEAQEEEKQEVKEESPSLNKGFELLEEVEKRIDEKLNQLKKLKYEQQLEGITQTPQRITKEQQIENECNEFLKDTGLKI